jgi:hypothetical protein
MTQNENNDLKIDNPESDSKEQQILDYNIQLRKTLPLAYFAPDTEEGRNLAENIVVPLCKEIGYTVEVLYASDANQILFLIASHLSAVVIVDCTIPDPLSKSSVYPLLSTQINIFDHILVISQTPLPLNIISLRKGGAPEDENKKFTDEDIKHWLEIQLCELKEAITSGKHYNRIPLQSIDDLATFRIEMEKMCESSLELKQSNNINKKKIFISYRSCHAEEVEKFKQEKMESDKSLDINIIPPRKLCSDDEALTPMRIWMLASLLDDNIRGVDEVWVYGTDDYTQSWWTMAELILVSYINQAGHSFPNKPEIKIRYFAKDKMSETFTEQTPPIKLPVILSEGQIKRIARLFSNCRPDIMGPEATKMIRKKRFLAYTLKFMGKYLRNKFISSISPIIEYQIPQTIPEKDKEDFKNSMLVMFKDPNLFIQYTRDEVFQSDFWNKLSISISSQTPAYNSGIIDVDKFLAMPMKNLRKYTVKELIKLADNQNVLHLEDKPSIDGKKIKKDYYVKLKKSRYLWMLSRFGKKNGDVAPGLDAIPRFSLTPVNKD